MWVEIRAICSVDKRISVAIADIPLLFLLFLLFSLVYLWLGVHFLYGVFSKPGVLLFPLLQSYNYFQNVYIIMLQSFIKPISLIFFFFFDGRNKLLQRINSMLFAFFRLPVMDRRIASVDKLYVVCLFSFPRDSAICKKAVNN